MRRLLWGIALWVALQASACGLSETPTATPTQAPTAAPTAPTSEKTATPTQTTQSGEITYIVQPGDTLSGIALKYNTTVDAIQKANNIQNPNLISVGQKLVVPRSP